MFGHLRKLIGAEMLLSLLQFGNQVFLESRQQRLGRFVKSRTDSRTLGLQARQLARQLHRVDSQAVLIHLSCKMMTALLHRIFLANPPGHFRDQLVRLLHAPGDVSRQLGMVRRVQKVRQSLTKIQQESIKRGG